MHSFFRIVGVVSLLLTITECSSGGSGTPSNSGNGPGGDPGPTPTDYTWTQLAPDGGFVSTVHYHPTRSDEVWASGDDSSGLYKSVDAGGQWRLNTATPLDHATYAFAFDPVDPDTIYAPNHFGRGLLKTTDSGSSWTLHTDGLSTAEAEKRINDIALDPNNSQLVFMALDGGLYQSSNAGSSFSKTTSASFDANTDNSFYAIAISSASEIYLGSDKGRVYKVATVELAGPS